MDELGNEDRIEDAREGKRKVLTMQTLQALIAAGETPAVGFKGEERAPLNDREAYAMTEDCCSRAPKKGHGVRAAHKITARGYRVTGHGYAVSVRSFARRAGFAVTVALQQAGAARLHAAVAAKRKELGYGE